MINTPYYIQHNHHGDSNVQFLAPSKWPFVTIPVIVTEFSRNSNFSPTCLRAPSLSRLTLKAPPPLPSSTGASWTIALSHRRQATPPKQLALGLSLSGLERMTSFPLFPSSTLSFYSSTEPYDEIRNRSHEQSSVSGGMEYTGCMVRPLTGQRSQVQGEKQIPTDSGYLM